MKLAVRAVLAAFVLFSLPSFATVAVTSPTAGSTVLSPVHYTASATTATCAKGVASMGIYVNNKKIYVVNGTTLNTTISLARGHSTPWLRNGTNAAERR